MKKSTRKLWPLLCAILIVSACQKETSTSKQEDVIKEYTGPRLTGVVPDDPARVAKVPLIFSSDFLKNKGSTILSADMSSARGKPVKPGFDLTAPTVSITSPSNGSTVSGTITIQVGASDNVAVSSVSLSVDGAIISTLNSAPYNFSWTVSSGTHTIKATAKDAAGNSSSNSITVSQNIIIADLTSPTVTITSPASGATVSGTVNVTVSASDNTGVSSVSLSVDGAVISTLTASPYTFPWNATSAADGAHTLTATAKDAAGNLNSHSITVAKNTTITILPPTTLPTSYSLLMPPPGQQGGEGSCAVFATTYAARSAEQFYRTNSSSYGYSTNIFSPEFVYDQIKTSDCGSGTGVTTSLDFLMSTGVCTWQSMPYSSFDGCSLVPTSLQTNEAVNYKIASYSRIMSSDITAIKTMIVNKHPVIITIATDQSFWDAQPGFIWKAYMAAPGISHALVISGYDDAKHAYKVMSSWGTTWGDAGYSWIDYNFLPQAAFYYSYVIN